MFSEYFYDSEECRNEGNPFHRKGFNNESKKNMSHLYVTRFPLHVSTIHTKGNQNYLKGVGIVFGIVEIMSEFCQLDNAKKKPIFSEDCKRICKLKISTNTVIAL